MNSTIRQPAVAGQFYPGKSETLLRDIGQYAEAVPGEQISALGCVVPHAGYMYSGHVAGAVYAKLALPKRYIILCPNHTGKGRPLAIMSEGAWRTPLGDARIDAELSAQLKSAAPLLSEDAVAHSTEHALEVQIPFLQTLTLDFSFVPVAVGVGDFDVLSTLGEAIAQVVSRAEGPVLVIASSDMNHYESDAVTRAKDAKAIERILALDARGLHEVVRRENITMCGYGPAVAMLTAAVRLGAKSAELIRYATSGDVSGDRNWVVGYAGIAIA
ncbi:MAG TPA: AmmeMemoRadiSam system protein B [Clostridia bacterium]|nr:AmmeMemoRadiSam system protein B [Clostridia bacterium]